MTTTRQTHDLLIRQAEASRVALQAIDTAEMAARLVCQAENVVNVSCVGLPSVKARHVALDDATRMAYRAYEHAQEARKAAGMGNIEATRREMHRCILREAAVRRLVQDAGLAVVGTYYS